MPGSSAAEATTLSMIAVTACAGDGLAPSASNRAKVSSAVLSAVSATAPMISSLLRKYRYTAPADRPDSPMMSAIEVAWNPLLANRRPAAATISVRRMARVLVSDPGHPPSLKANVRS